MFHYLVQQFYWLLMDIEDYSKDHSHYDIARLMHRIEHWMLGKFDLIPF